MPQRSKSDVLGLRRPTIPVVYPRLLLETLDERGIARADALRGTGLRDDASLRQPDACITPTQWGRLVLSVIRLTGDAGIGLEQGLRQRLSAHGFLGYAAMTAADLRQSLQVTVRYYRMRMRQYQLIYTEDGEGAWIEMRAIQPVPVLQHHLLYEFALVGIAQAVAPLTGSKPEGLRLEFTWSQPDYFARYRERLPATRFACAANRLHIPAAWLDRPLLMADEIAHQQTLKQVEREYASVRHEEGDIVERVRAELVLSARGYPAFEELAQRLLLSRRTLRRRLLDAGSSYRTLLQDARRRDAMQLLKASDLDIQSVALRLGFSDPANFTRAFRRWFGAAPSHYRDGS